MSLLPVEHFFAGDTLSALHFRIEESVSCGVGFRKIYNNLLQSALQSFHQKSNTYYQTCPLHCLLLSLIQHSFDILEATKSMITNKESLVNYLVVLRKSI
jgi:hypothetical protein